MTGGAVLAICAAFSYLVIGSGDKPALISLFRIRCGKMVHLLPRMI